MFGVQHPNAGGFLQYLYLSILGSMFLDKSCLHKVLVGLNTYLKLLFILAADAITALISMKTIVPPLNHSLACCGPYSNRPFNCKPPNYCITVLKNWFTYGYAT